MVQAQGCVSTVRMRWVSRGLPSLADQAGPPSQRIRAVLLLTVDPAPHGGS
jgi:hypothetical protein